MRSARFGLLALAGLVAGQTPVGFKPEVSAHLGVKFGTKEVDVPGTAMTKAGPSKALTLSSEWPPIKKTRSLTENYRDRKGAHNQHQGAPRRELYPHRL